MSDYFTRLSEGYAAYQAAVGELAAAAREAAAEAEQRYSAELFAGSGGDDAAARIGAAWLRYQQDMAKLSYEHWRDVRAHLQELGKAIHEAQSDAAAAAYQRYVEGMEAFSARADASQASAAPKPSTPSGRRTRRRATGSSG